MGQFLLISMISLPLVMAVVLLLLRKASPHLARSFAIMTSVIVLVLALGIVYKFEPRTNVTAVAPFSPDPQFTIQYGWFDFAISPTANSSKLSGITFFLGVDGLSIWMLLLTALATLPAIIFSHELGRDKPASFYALMLLLEGALLGVFCSFDIILFYIFFELTLIPLFFLIGLWGGAQKRFAARKFVAYTLVGSLLGLVGLVGIVISRANLDGFPVFSIVELAQSHEVSPLRYDLQKWLFFCMAFAFAIKLPLFPFHTWQPLSYTEAPLPVTIVMAAVVGKLGLFGFLRIVLPILPDATVSLGLPIIGTLSVIGVLYGAVAAFAQDDMRKLLAYSSLSHLGFCAMGVFSTTEQGITGGTIQMLNHGLTSILLFLLVGILYERYKTRSIAALGGLASRLKLFAVVFVFACMANVGLPLLNGFVGEILCIVGMYKVKPWYAGLAILGVVLSAWYMLTWAMRILFGPLKEASWPSPVPGQKLAPLTHDLTDVEKLCLYPLVILCLGIGLYPKPFLDRIRPECSALSQRLEAARNPLSAPSIGPARIVLEK